MHILVYHIYIYIYYVVNIIILILISQNVSITPVTEITKDEVHSDALILYIYNYEYLQKKQ